MEESNPQFANALRRIMISEVPILAVEYIDVNINDSVLYNEVIAQRLGLLPLIFNPKDFKFKEEGKKGSQYEVVFAINKKGPTMVYAKDMKSSNPEVRPLFDDTPVVELFGDQKLKLEAVASLGVGKNHAKYQASSTYYRYHPVVKLNGKIKNPEEAVKVCPKEALKINGNKASVTLSCDMCQECVNIAQPEGVLEVSGNPTKFIFHVESISGLGAEEIVLIAVDILKKKLKDFQKELKKLK
jgi:DNA-directed RNA polymerase subunit D